MHVEEWSALISRVRPSHCLQNKQQRISQPLGLISDQGALFYSPTSQPTFLREGTHQYAVQI